MQRDKVTEKLGRIIATIESQQMPIRVMEVYVFGSYGRGALQCGDLDMVIVTDKPTEADDRRCQDRNWMSFPDYEKAFRKALKKARSERVQILLARGSLAEAIHGMRFTAEDCVLIWNGDNRWRERVAAIRPDPSAGRAARRQYIFTDRGFARDGERHWQWLDDGVACGAVMMRKLPVEEFLDSKWPEVERCREPGLLTDEMADLMNIAFTYIARQKKCPQLHGIGRSWMADSQDGSIRFYLGRPQVGYVNGWLRDSDVEQACALPFLRRRKANYIWVFHRGDGFPMHAEKPDC